MSSLVPEDPQNPQMTEEQKRLFRLMVVQSLSDLGQLTQRSNPQTVVLPQDNASSNIKAIAKGIAITMVIVGLGVPIATVRGQPVTVRIMDLVLLDTAGKSSKDTEQDSKKIQKDNESTKN